jgi:hypothetical protein
MLGEHASAVTPRSPEGQQVFLAAVELAASPLMGSLDPYG